MCGSAHNGILYSYSVDINNWMCAWCTFRWQFLVAHFAFSFFISLTHRINERAREPSTTSQHATHGTQSPVLLELLVTQHPFSYTVYVYIIILCSFSVDKAIIIAKIQISRPHLVGVFNGFRWCAHSIHYLSVCRFFIKWDGNSCVNNIDWRSNQKAYRRGKKREILNWRRNKSLE